MATFYDQYVKPYLTSAAQTAAVNLATQQFMDRGMTQEDAYRAAYQLVTGQTLPTIETSWWDKDIFGIKMPYIIGAGALFFVYGVWKSR